MKPTTTVKIQVVPLLYDGEYALIVPQNYHNNVLGAEKVMTAIGRKDYRFCVVTPKSDIIEVEIEQEEMN